LLARFVDAASPVIQSRVARALVLRSHRSHGRSVRQEVEDLTQEVFASLFAERGKALRAWDPARGMSLRSFVALVADRQVSSILRTSKRSPWTEDPTFQEDLERSADAHAARAPNGLPTSGAAGAGPEQRVASAELLGQVLARLREQLSPLGMQLFELVCIEEASVPQIAEQMKMTPDAIYAWRSRLVRLARKIQAELLSENQGTPRMQCVGD
jgi:RNA polymerase sigma-70 factor (ECF subfamily)